MSEGFNKYLEKINEQILKNDNLLKLLHYDSANALSQPNLTEEEKNKLIYSRIFPYRFIPDIKDTVSSYLNLGFSNFKEISNVFQAGKIGFYVVSHKDLWRMNGGLRPIFMLEEIKNVADGLSGLGLGKLKLKDIAEYGYNENYLGYVVMYEITDFS